MKLIPLTQGKYAKVDDADFDWLNQWKWTYHSGGYAYRQIRKKGQKVISILMHRLILGLHVGDLRQVDHENRDKLDNQRHNLRAAESTYNTANRPKFSNKPNGTSSKHKGVSLMKHRGLWEAYININRKRTRLGYFASEAEAALAYNAAARKLHGEFAVLNEV